MNRQGSAPISHINSKPTQLSDADKIRLFDQAFSSRTITPKSTASANAALAVNEEREEAEEEVINLTTAYSAIASSSDGKDDYFMDTGSNKDICNNVRIFKKLRNIRPVTIKSANGGKMVATQAGDVEIKTFDFDNNEFKTPICDVLYCPEVAVNLISATKLCDLGFVLNGDSSSMSFTHTNGNKIFACWNPNSMDLWKARVSNTLTQPTISNSSMHNKINGAHTPKAYNAVADLHHQRLAHLHSSALQRFCEDGDRMTGKCTSCIMAKSTRKPFSSHLPNTNCLLYRVHSDVVGPIQSATSAGKRYFVTFIDEASRYNKIFLISHKSQVFESFRTYMAEAERHTGEKICILKSDRGGEYRSSQLLAFAATNGIIMEQGPAKTPQHNSVAERFNRTIMEKARAQMIHANLPVHLWGEVVSATSHILNLTPSSITKDSPVNKWMAHTVDGGGHMADISFLRVIGCAAYAHIHNDERRKLDAKAVPKVLVGYEPNSKAYRPYDTSTTLVMISRDVTFIESVFPLRHQQQHDQVCHTDNPIEDFWFPRDEIPHTLPTVQPSLDDTPSTTSSNMKHPQDSSTKTPAVGNSAPRPSRNIKPIERLGNLQTYAAVASGKHDEDNPTYEQAMKGPDKEHWMQAMKDEYCSFVQHRVGRLVKRTNDMNVVGGMWRLKRKRNTLGEITAYKARWVILGNRQIKGIDFMKTYASVVVKESLYAMLSLAASDDLEFEAFDIKTAFLTGTNEMPVHTAQMKGFNDNSGDILVLDQAVYGTRQAHRQFNATLKEKYASIGLHSSEVDDSLYSRWVGKSFVHIHMHVDDGAVISNDIDLLRSVQKSIHQIYEVKWHAKPTEHLGVRITRDRAARTIHLSQENYLTDVLERFGMSDSKPVITPISPCVHLVPASADDHEECKGFPYLEIIGSLNHASVDTQPDISYAVSTLAQFSTSYGTDHITAIKHLMWYIKGNVDRGVSFRATSTSSHILQAYADADYANDASHRRSVTGYTINLGGSTVCWRTRRQKSVALSTTEAEYMAMADCSKHIVWFRKLIYVLSHSRPIPTDILMPPSALFNDNNGAVFLSQEAAVNSRSKHIDIRHHYIRELVKNEIICPTQIDTKAMPADYLTKAATKPVLDTCRKLVGNLSLEELNESK